MLITQEDINILRQPQKKIYIKIGLAEMYKKVNNRKVFTQSYKLIGELQGEVKDGNFSCDAESDIRRTFNVDFVIKDDTFNLGYDKKIWTDKFIIPSIGIYSNMSQSIKWYGLGVFAMKDISYNSSENSLSLSLVDLVALINGDLGGTIKGATSVKLESAIQCSDVSFSFSSGYLLISITKNDYSNTYTDRLIGFVMNATQAEQYKNAPVYIKINNLAQCQMVDYYNNPITVKELRNGYPYSCYHKDNTNYFVYNGMNSIRGGIESILEVGGITDYQIGNIGKEQSVTEENSMPWLIPYDLEYGIDEKIYGIVSQLRDLYSGWETFFDEEGKFICQRIPTGSDEDNFLDEHIFNGLVISENNSYDLSTIKNVTEIFGKELEVDHYVETPTKVTLSGSSLLID